jgi:hypothetical protein
MSIAQFSKTIQSQVYKNWLSTLDKNIVTNSAESLRSSQQTASKTSFYITRDTVLDMYKTITGKSLDSTELQLFMQELAKPVGQKSTQALAGESISINGKPAIFFKNIGFDTISTRLNSILNSYPEVEEAYQQAEEEYFEAELAKLKASPEYKKLKAGRARQDAEDAIAKRAKERATLGFYFNKGHVVSIATNLTKQFREKLRAADVLAKEQRDLLIQVLDRYIDKLQEDDLATANLPNAVTQELYAGYVKSSDTYLVEMQHRVGNIEAGSASIPIVKELRDIFSISSKQLADSLTKSPALGSALLTTEGSPSFTQLLAQDIADIIAGKKQKKKVYVQKPKLVSKVTRKVTKPKKNTKKIADAKKLKQKLTSTKTSADAIKTVPFPTIGTSLVDLQLLLNAELSKRIKENMGDGSSRSVLNNRTGRLAESAKVVKLSESRAGMITAFYTYMKNPYATFSEGGRQQSPRSRDPKLLISKSIREIAETEVANRLRAVLV